MVNRIMTDAETLIIGLAYPASPQGRILSAWRHGALELVVERNTLDQFAFILDQLASEVGLSRLRINDEISAFRLGCLVPIADTIPWDPERREPLCLGASHFVSEDRGWLSEGPDFPLITPACFWATFG